MLTDACAILALLVEKDEWSPACIRFAERLNESMVTTQIVFGEAMHHMGSRDGYRGQDNLWKLVRKGDLFLIANEPDETARMDELMLKYQDASKRGGMDLGDASLVAAAETLGEVDIFTTDEHFYSYQLANGKYFNVHPGAK